MTTAEIDIDAPPAATHAVLLDATTYPRWLVGAKRIRATDADWPAVGSSFHHAVGAGPLTIHDRTTMLDDDGATGLTLEAHVGPLGSATVRFELTGIDGGTRTHLAIDEEPSSGLARWLWRTPARPLVAVSLWGRNALSLDALRDLVEDRDQEDTTPVTEQTGPV